MILLREIQLLYAQGKGLPRIVRSAESNCWLGSEFTDIPSRCRELVWKLSQFPWKNNVGQKIINCTFRRAKPGEYLFHAVLSIFKIDPAQLTVSVREGQTIDHPCLVLDLGLIGLDKMIQGQKQLLITEASIVVIQTCQQDDHVGVAEFRPGRRAVLGSIRD